MAWEKVHIPFAQGLNTRAEDRAMQPPSLEICRNAEFTELGGIQKRKPYEGMSTDTVDGGSLSDVRKIVSYDGELLCFTKTKLYSWSERDSAWAERSEYLAPSLTERSRFISNEEQICGDRAELGGVTVYAWEASGDQCYIAAIDSETGAVLLPPTDLDDSASTRPRLLAMDSKILLFWNSPPNLKGFALDPDDITTTPTSATTTTLNINSNGEYDVEKLTDTTAVVADRTTSDEYQLDVRNESVSNTASASVTRTCDGPISVTVTADGSTICVSRADSTSVYADLIGSDLSDTANVNVQVGSGVSTPVNQITSVWESNSTCRVFWTGGESDNGGFSTDSNTIDSDGTTGTAAGVAYNLSLASRAFLHGGRAFAWMAFAGRSQSSVSVSEVIRGALQNTYFLFDEDGTMHAKAVMHQGGGFSDRDGYLPGVQDLGSDTYAWCAGERRLIEVGDNQGGYSQRGLRDVVLEFDSNKARRVAQLGRTLYVSGAQILQYDGRALTEANFHIAPWMLLPEANSTGSLDTGKYTYVSSWRWNNAKGEIERSTTMTSGIVEVDGTEYVLLSIRPLTTTLKPGVAIEWWRTKVDPSDGAPMYLTTSKDPSTSGDNSYIENDPDTGSLVTATDDLADSDLGSKESWPEAQASDGTQALESLAPPAASIVVAGADRLYLAGVAHEPNTVWYSQLRGEGEVAKFHDGLRVTLPSSYGAITALEVIGETLVVFQERAVHVVPGQGIDNTGGGQNLGPARRISSDIGAISQDTLGVTPAGIVFHSPKGWYLLDRNFSLQYIGGPVFDFDDDTFVSVDVMEAEQQVRCLSEESRMLVFDWVAQQWSEWTIDDGLDSVIWDGTHVYLSTTGPKTQRTDMDGAHEYKLDVETAWIKLDGLLGYKRLRRFALLGEGDSFSIRTRVAVDYEEAYVQDDLDAPEGVSGYQIFTETDSSWSPPEGAIGPIVFEGVAHGGEWHNETVGAYEGGGGGEYARASKENINGPYQVQVGGLDTQTFVLDGNSDTVIIANAGGTGTSTEVGGSGGTGDVVYAGGTGGQNDGSDSGGGGGAASGWRDGAGANGKDANGDDGGLPGTGDGGSGGRGGDRGSAGVPDSDATPADGQFPGGGAGGKGSTTDNAPRTGDAGSAVVVAYWGGHPFLSRAEIEAEAFGSS